MEGHCKPFPSFQRCRGYDRVDGRLKRIASDYTLPDYFASETLFGVSDLISLGALHLRTRDRGPECTRNFYADAYRSCFKGIGFDPERDFVDHRHSALPALEQLTRIRVSLISFEDEFGELLEGDPWGAREIDAPTTQINAARDWYLTHADHLLRGIEILDTAIGALMNWNMARTVTYCTLQRNYDYPDVEAYWDQHCMP